MRTINDMRSGINSFLEGLLIIQEQAEEARQYFNNSQYEKGLLKLDKVIERLEETTGVKSITSTGE